jgi:hypothetical protein
MARTDAPVGLDRERHQDLTGRGHHVWWRRAALAVIAAVPILGLLNVFGQRTTVDSAHGPAASLLVNSPVHVRGGLIFTTEIVITPRQQLQDARLYLDDGWLAGQRERPGPVGGLGLRQDSRWRGVPRVDLMAGQRHERGQASPECGAL